jgi:hypothetical protein
LVADAFLGECPAVHEIRHKDGDCTQNELSNLEYITRQESQTRFVMATGGYSVNLTKRIQTTNGRRPCPVIESANSRVKPDQGDIAPLFVPRGNAGYLMITCIKLPTSQQTRSHEPERRLTPNALPVMRHGCEIRNQSRD